MRFIFIILIIILIFQILFRWVIPYFLKRKVNKMQDEYKKRQEDYYRSGKNEGDVTIENIPTDRKNKDRKKRKDEEGEYADYEEIE